MIMKILKWMFKEFSAINVPPFQLMVLKWHHPKLFETCWYNSYSLKKEHALEEWVSNQDPQYPGKMSEKVISDKTIKFWLMFQLLI